MIITGQGSHPSAPSRPRREPASEQPQDSVRLSAPPDDAKSRARWVKRTLKEANAEVARSNPRGWRAKREKMALSPFLFFRGSSTLYYLDLAARCPPPKDEPRLRLNGDVHPENFGTYTSSEDRLLYDLNDFDETVKSGPFSWDVRRGVTGWMLAAQQGGHDARALGEAFLEGFTEQIRHFANHEDQGSFRVDEKRSDGPVHDLLAEMSQVDPDAYIDKLTDEDRFRPADNLIRKPQLEKTLEKKLHRKIDDVALKTDSGTASLGLTRLYVLEDEDTLLELKQELPSSLEGVPFIMGGGGANRAREVAAAAATLPAEPYRELDSFMIASAALGAVQPSEGDRTSFLVRERPASKATLDLDELSEKDMLSAATTQGQLLAAAMARQTVSERPAAKAIKAYLGDHPELAEELLKDCAVSMKRVLADYRAFKG